MRVEPLPDPVELLELVASELVEEQAAQALDVGARTLLEQVEAAPGEDGVGSAPVVLGVAARDEPLPL